VAVAGGGVIAADGVVTAEEVTGFGVPVFPAQAETGRTTSAVKPITNNLLFRNMFILR
jgi:hypothetical protein